MVEHLLGQCTALTEAMNHKHKKAYSTEKNGTTNLQAVNHSTAFIDFRQESV